MPEQMNLSDALDLIAQSKADIKSSVQGKGGTIGDDLTQYDTSINNLKFSYLSSSLFNEANSIYPGSPCDFPIKVYDDATHQLIDIDPDDITVSISPTMIQDLEIAEQFTYDSGACTVTKGYLDPSQEEGTMITAEQGTTGGKCNVIVHYAKGNIDYIGTLTANNPVAVVALSSAEEVSSGDPITVSGTWVGAVPNTAMKIYPSFTINSTSYTPSNSDTITLAIAANNPNTGRQIINPYTITWANGYWTLTPNSNKLVGVEEVTGFIAWSNSGRDIYQELQFTISETPPVEYYFTNPTEGTTLESAYDPESLVANWPIEINGVENLDDIVTYTTVDEDSASAGLYIEAVTGDDGEGNDVTTGVTINIPEGNGQCTLTYDDGEHSCTVTFDYNVTAPEPEE